jgi:hypothetical protein
LIKSGRAVAVDAADAVDVKAEKKMNSRVDLRLPNLRLPNLRLPNLRLPNLRLPNLRHPESHQSLRSLHPQ